MTSKQAAAVARIRERRYVNDVGQPDPDIDTVLDALAEAEAQASDDRHRTLRLSVELGEQDARIVQLEEENRDLLLGRRAAEITDAHLQAANRLITHLVAGLRAVEDEGCRCLITREQDCTCEAYLLARKTLADAGYPVDA